eukprot:3260816-Amphidinium_carterae.1
MTRTPFFSHRGSVQVVVPLGCGRVVNGAGSEPSACLREASSLLTAVETTHAHAGRLWQALALNYHRRGHRCHLSAKKSLLWGDTNYKKNAKKTLPLFCPCCATFTRFVRFPCQNGRVS